jgi:hypothetical protein
VTAVGASTFETYGDGTDVHAAFHDAVEQAGWEHGHGGYTGTIAEKTDYVIITREPMSYDDASRLASDLIHGDDPRVADKWGPAGALPVRQPTSPAGQQDPDGWLFFGFASS